MLLRIILIVLLFSSKTYAFDKWTVTDTALETTFFATMLIDRNQTIEVVCNKNGREIGWAKSFIGEYPSKGEVTSYMVTMSLLHAGIAYVLPKPYRTYWQMFFIGVELNTINNNHKLNGAISLKF